MGQWNRKWIYCSGLCRPMIHKPLLLKGLKIRVPFKAPIKRRGFINQGFTFSKSLSFHPEVIPHAGISLQRSGQG